MCHYKEEFLHNDTICFPHRTSSLLHTLLLCTRSPPSSPMRRWCMTKVRACHLPAIRITSHSMHSLLFFPKSHNQPYVSVFHSSHILLRTPLVCVVCVCFQPLGVQGGDSVRVRPSVTEEQAVSYW